MIEVVVPDALSEYALLDDNRFSLTRKMVGRHVFAFEGPLEEGLSIAEQLSDDSPGPPVLVNNVTEQGKK